MYFKYKWKSSDQEIIGEKECSDKLELELHIKNLGGELVDILEQKETVTVLNMDKKQDDILNSPVEKKPYQPSVNTKPFKEPSTAIQVIAGLYFIATIVMYVFFVIFLINAFREGGVYINNNFVDRLLHLVLFFIFIFLIFSAPAILGAGLLLLKKWARIIIIVLSCLDILNAVFALFRSHISIPVLGIFYLIFFNLKEVKEQFR
jgi:hypothetical protein